MIAYNRDWLQNLSLRSTAGDAVDLKIISAEEKDKIAERYPVAFYTPDYFIRVGLFVLSCIIGFFALGLLFLLFMSVLEHFYQALIFIFAVISYFVLNFFVRKKNHFRSGADAALQWISAISIVSSINLMAELSMLENALLFLVISVWFALRFANRLMSVIAVVSFLAVVFFSFLHAGSFARMLMPFVLMGISTIVYFSAKRFLARATLHCYRECLQAIEITALIIIFAAVNYYVVREASIQMFSLQLQPGESIPFGWLFWILTFSIPSIYVGVGLFKKDIILLRTGLGLVAAIIFTVRYYYSIMPFELLMVIGGGIMIILAYLVTKFLTTPRRGFTALDTDLKAGGDKLNIETLIIAESFAHDSSPQRGSRFGGGSFGGGGSSADF